MTPVRPLPQPTLASAEFWRSGTDGVLRISHCDDCGRYFHPPTPVCPSCRGGAVSLAPTSGKAVVVGFSVNHQTWLPSFPPPYVVAVVALAEDDRARLTTNIVGCDPDDVHVGMRVQVRFEQQEDVYLPLFEPDPDDTEGPLPEPHEITPRPMASAKKYEDKVALTGVGQSRVGRRLMVDPVALTVEACLAAVADAGLDLDEIDGLSTYPGPMPGGLSEGGITAVTEALQLFPTWVNGAREVPGQIGSITAAMLAVAAKGDGSGSLSFARHLGLEHMAEHGVQGRGVLIDLAHHVGTEWQPVNLKTLQEIMAADNVVVEPGDILLLHTGMATQVLAWNKNPDPVAIHTTGSYLDAHDPALLDWIAESQISALVADNYAVEGVGPGMPPPTDMTPHTLLPIHNLCLFKLGVPLGELWYLDKLATWLREHKRSRFLLTAPPLNLPGTQGSPLTPVATV